MWTEIFLLLIEKTIFSSFWNIFEHHGGKLLVRNLPISVFVDLGNELLHNLLVQILTETQNLLQLLGGDWTAAIFVEHLECGL